MGGWVGGLTYPPRPPLISRDGFLTPAASPSARMRRVGTVGGLGGWVGGWVGGAGR